MRQGRGGIARAVAATALLIMLVVGVFAPRVAWADEVGTGTGTIKITPSDGNGSNMVYRAYKIFTADVDPDAYYYYQATNIDWPSTDMATTVRSAINTYDRTKSTGEWPAAQCASFIVDYFIHTGERGIVGANAFAMNLAKALDDLNPTATFNSGVSQQLDEGYYLIISVPAIVDGSALSSESANMGTSPIFIMVGNGQSLSITEKVSMPTLTKTMIEDSTGTARSYGDAQLGQEVSYTLTGTLPYSIDAFTSYKYTFVDELPDGMDLKMAGTEFAESDLKVQITIGTTVYTVDPSSFVATYSGRTLTVDFPNLRSATPEGTPYDPTDSKTKTIPVDAAAVVTVTYAACLNGSAVLGATAGNTNTAHLVYANDPMAPNSTGTGAIVTATTYTYGLTLTKVDKKLELDGDSSTFTKLSDAKFTIQDADSGCYIKNDGTLGNTTLPDESDSTYSSDYLFTTGTDGTISIRGLDSGTYTIHEVEAPGGYMPAEDLKLTLSVAESTEEGIVGKPTAVSVGLTGGENDGTGDKGTRASYDSSTGYVSIVATNKKAQLPLTGLSGITLVYVAGGTILLASLVVIVRRRIQGKDE